MKEAGKLNIAKSLELYEEAVGLVPGGVLGARKPTDFIAGEYPVFIESGKGGRLIDVDGNEIIDFLCGYGPIILGYREKEVDEAVYKQITEKGFCFSLTQKYQNELAKKIAELVPSAEMSIFLKTGSDATTAAVRIARAYTNKLKVMRCGYHGWHDWYLAANLGDGDALRGHLLPGLEPAGVPEALRGTTLAFTYGDAAPFDAIVNEHGNQLAAVIMEPCRHQDPPPGFLEHIRARTHAAGAALIFDEITIGWRLIHGGSHLRLGVTPIMAVFAKALGNGHPIGAVIGSSAAMEGAHTSFISSTSWTESVGAVAALATLDAMERNRPWKHVDRIGRRVQHIWCDAGERHGLPVHVPDAYPCLAHFRFEHAEANALRTLFTQRMLARGFLAAGAFYPTLSHTNTIVSQYATAVDAVFAEVAQVIAENRIEESLEGPPAHEGFRRLL